MKIKDDIILFLDSLKSKKDFCQEDIDFLNTFYKFNLFWFIINGIITIILIFT